MAIAVERVEISPNPVLVKGQVRIAVTIVTHDFLAKSVHRDLKSYTHGQLKARGYEK